MIVQSTIERAFEIAKSGDCHSVPDLGKKLVKEGFEDVSRHLNGVVLRKQLSALMKAAQIDPCLEPHLSQQALETARICPFKDSYFQVGG